MCRNFAYKLADLVRVRAAAQKTNKYGWSFMIKPWPERIFVKTRNVVTAVARWIFRATAKITKWVFIFLVLHAAYLVSVHYFIALPRLKGLGEAVCTAAREDKVESLITERAVPYALPLFNFAKALIAEREFLNDLKQDCHIVVAWGYADCIWYDMDVEKDGFPPWLVHYFEFASSYSMEIWSRERSVMWLVDIAGWYSSFGNASPLWLNLDPRARTGLTESDRCPAADRMREARVEAGFDPITLQPMQS